MWIQIGKEGPATAPKGTPAAHSHVLGVLFALVLLDASIIGAAAVTLSTSYAFGDMFGVHHSLHRGFRDAKPSTPVTRPWWWSPPGSC